MDDLTLLRQYARDRSEPAFRRLVEVHAHWVYSAAVRQVCDAHLASLQSISIDYDVTESFFPRVAPAPAAPNAAPAPAPAAAPPDPRRHGHAQDRHRALRRPLRFPQRRRPPRGQVLRRSPGRPATGPRRPHGRPDRDLRRRTTRTTARPRRRPRRNFLDQLEGLELRIDGDTATLSAPRRPDPAMHLVRADDGWKVRDLPGGGPGLIRGALAMADVANRLTAEVSEGKFASPAEISRQIHPRLRARMQEPPRPDK